MTSERIFREHATRGFAWNYLYKLSEFGLMNLYAMLVVRHFGPEISPPYAVFITLCSTISIISGFAVDGVLLRYTQRISANEQSVTGDFSDVESLGFKKFFTTLFAFRILVVTAVSIVIFLAIYCLPIFIPSLGNSFGTIREFSPYLFVFLYAQAIIAFCTFSLIALLETKRIFFSSLISRGLLLSLGLFLVLQAGLTLHYAVGLYVASAVINAVFLLFIFSHELNIYSIKSHSQKFPFSAVLKELWGLIKGRRHIKLFLATPVMLYGIATWGSDLLSTVLGKQPDIIMMRAMLGESSSEIGYYFAASQLILMTEYVFLFGLGGTLVSIFSKLAHDDEKDVIVKVGSFPRLANARKEIHAFQNVMILPLCAYMLVFAPDVIRSVYGNKFDMAIPMVRVGLVALTLAVGVFGGGMPITSLVAVGKQRFVFRNRLYWGVTNIVANVLLIIYFGGFGAIIGTQFANAFACGTESYFANKIFGHSLNTVGTLLIVGVSLTSVTAGYYFIQILGLSGKPLSTVVVSTLFVGLTTSGLYFLLKVPEAKKVWQRVQGLFNQSNSAVRVNE